MEKFFSICFFETSSIVFLLIIVKEFKKKVFVKVKHRKK